MIEQHFNRVGQFRRTQFVSTDVASARASTEVSTARIALSGVAPDALLQLIESPRFGRLNSKYGPMDILGTEAPGAADDDVAALFVPFEDGAWANAEPSPYVRWNRNPPCAVTLDRAIAIPDISG